jgi:hypothetical protein
MPPSEAPGRRVQKYTTAGRAKRAQQHVRKKELSSEELFRPAHPPRNSNVVYFSRGDVVQAHSFGEVADCQSWASYYV